MSGMARFFLLSILSILLFAFFCWGYFTKKNSIFPYPIIKITKSYIWPDHYSLLETNQKTRSEMILLDIKQNRLKYKYNKWETLKPNEFLFQFKKIIKKKYYPGMNIFSDRDYINHTNDKRLEGLTLIQIPRHYIKNIKLDVFDDIIIYRILCEKNNNKKYQNWEKLDFTLTIIGDQCIHKEIVRKKFKKGVVKMKAGGPKSSDPIFIDNLSRTEQKFKIL